MNSRGKIRILPLVGGHPGLDLLNTIEGAGEPGAIEHLHGPGDLDIWLSRVADGGEVPAADIATFHYALRIRELLRQLVSAHADGTDPSPEALSEAEAICKSAYARQHLAWADGGLIWHVDRTDAESMLTDIVRATADLLTGPGLPVIRKCPGDVCGWFFIDTSRNKSRRWCTMEFCGNRTKVRKFRTAQAADRHTH